MTRPGSYSMVILVLLMSCGYGSPETVLLVAQDGSDGYTTISAAVAAAPAHSVEPVRIHVKSGTYEENVVVPRDKVNMTLSGDGKDTTFLVGNRSLPGIWSMRETATLAVDADDFMLTDMSVENTAGPLTEQAVALRLSSERAVIFRCNISGFQDTLYAQKGRQYYRDVDLYGTIDFLYGEATIVVQQSRLWSRAPRSGQVNVITADGRRSAGDTNGFVIDRCKFIAAPDLNPEVTRTFLGRPWKPFSRVIVMRSVIGGHIDAEGWTPWNSSADGLDTHYYGEYSNTGPGAALDGRVKWPGYHVLGDKEVQQFKVPSFIHGETWLPAKGVPYDG